MGYVTDQLRKTQLARVRFKPLSGNVGYVTLPVFRPCNYRVCEGWFFAKINVSLRNTLLRCNFFVTFAVVMLLSDAGKPHGYRVSCFMAVCV